MAVKKAARSTRSTRTTKASAKSASSDIVLDENVDLGSEISDGKKKTSKSTTASKKVLGERDAPNNDTSSPVKEEKASKSSSDSKTPTTKSSKSKRTKKPAVETAESSRATTPVPSSPTKQLQRSIPEDQVQTCLQNFDLNAEMGMAKMRAALDISVQTSITRMRLAIERIPRAVRQLTLGDFIDEYGADIHAFMGRAPVQHLEDTQKEWVQIREECSPVKGKRSKKEEDAIRNSKAARTTANPTAVRSSTTATTSTATRKKTTATSTVRPTTIATGRAARRSAAALPTTPISPLPSSSSRPAPSLSTFQPNLPKEAMQTPKPQPPRMARPGEIIQWLSINGSPICGMIGEDGVVRPVTFA